MFLSLWNLTNIWNGDLRGPPLAKRFWYLGAHYLIAIHNVSSAHARK